MKKKTVPSAEEKTQENAEKAPDVPETQPSSVDTGKRTEEKQVSASPEPSFVGIDAVLSKVDQGMLEKADIMGMGDLVRALMLWGKSVDGKFNVVGASLQQLDKRFEGMPTEDSIADKFMEKLKQEREKAIATTQTQPQERQSQGGGDEVKMLLKMLEGEGGGRTSNPVQEKMNKLTDAILDKAIEGVTNPKSSKFEEYFEEELAKAKAKTMARALTDEPGAGH